MNSHLTSESSKIMQGFGWLNTLYTIAREGVFTKEPYNAVESVLKENLYSVFTYYSFKTAENEFNEAAREEVKKKTKNK